CATAPFDHERRLVSVLADGPHGRTVITKGAPEAVLDRCAEVPEGSRAVLAHALEDGTRVVAVATRAGAGMTTVSPADEQSLELAGFLYFLDRPKASAGPALARLHGLGVNVKVVT